MKQKSAFWSYVFETQRIFSFFRWSPFRWSKNCPMVEHRWQNFFPPMVEHRYRSKKTDGRDPMPIKKNRWSNPDTYQKKPMVEQRYRFQKNRWSNFDHQFKKLSSPIFKPRYQSWNTDGQCTRETPISDHRSFFWTPSTSALTIRNLGKIL